MTMPESPRPGIMWFPLGVGSLAIVAALAIAIARRVSGLAREPPGLVYACDDVNHGAPARSGQFGTLPGTEPMRSARLTTGDRVLSASFVAVDGAEGGPDFVDPAANRVSTRQAIQDAAPKTAEGDFIDPNIGQTIPKEGPFDYGHTPGNEWWRTQQMAREQGWTRQKVIEYENDPVHYQIEDPSSNRSHLYEMPAG